jgi:D-glycero-D-manno-heptose 1,7-bisphosphate phosphatase
MNKALFLDRDGVINKDVGYPYTPEQIVFNEEIFPLCRKAVDKGYILIVVTNQAGVARGQFTEKDVVSLNRWMADRFTEKGLTIAASYYCPYHPKAIVEKYRKDSDWRKPGAGMFLQAAKDHSIDLRSSLMVGDKPSDRINIPGLKSIILKSKYTGDDFDVESLPDVEKYL